MRRSKRQGRDRLSNRGILSRLERIERGLDRDEDLSQSPFKNWFARFETYWLTRFMIGLGAWLFVLTIITFVLEWRSFQATEIDRQRDREVQRLARVAQAWDVLLRPASGNIGKGNAFNLLLADGEGMQLADFSCESVGLWVDGTCKHPAVFADVDLTKTMLVDEPFVTAGSRLTSISFAQNMVRDLKAGALRLGDTFQDVSAFGWNVQEMRSNIHDVPENQRLFGKFKCTSCVVHAGEISWELFTRFGSSSVGGVTVIVPADLEPDREDLFYLATVLDNPVRIVKANDEPGNLPGFVTAYFADEAAATDALIWPIYEGIEYCANESDYATLEAAGRLKDNIKFENSRLPGYRCKFDFSEVEPLLRERLADWDIAYRGGTLHLASKPEWLRE